MITIFVHRNGRTEQATEIDRGWLNPASGVALWVDLAAPSIPELLILSDTFAFHPLSVEDARSAMQYPKAEAYDGYLYIILHGIDFHAREHSFATHDVDFFLGPNYLVTVHDGHSPVDHGAARARDAEPEDSRRGAGRAVPPHRRRDGRLSTGRKWRSSRSGSTSSRRPFSSIPINELVREILEEKRQVASLRRDRHAAARRRSPASRGATSSTSAPRCRSGSATSTITWSGSPTTR